MKALFLFLTIFFISFNPDTALGFKCTERNTPVLGSLVASGKTPQEAQAIWDAKCKVTAPASKKEIKKKLDCSACLNQKLARHQGLPCLRYVTNCPTIYEEQCKAEKKCQVTHSGSSYTEFKAEENTILPCGDELYCSEDTKMCEYICDSGFSYNFQSGMCEKACAEGDIVEDNQCVACTGDLVPNSTNTYCQCPRSDLSQVGDSCICPGDLIDSGSACVCAPHLVKIGSTCQCPVAAMEDMGNYCACPGGKIQVGSSCQCPSGMIEIGGQCSPTNCSSSYWTRIECGDIPEGYGIIGDGDSGLVYSISAPSCDGYMLLTSSDLIPWKWTCGNINDLDEGSSCFYGMRSPGIFYCFLED